MKFIELMEKIRFIAGVFLLLAAVLPVEAIGEPPSLEKTVSVLATLSQAPETTRDEVQDVTRAFMKIYRKARDPRTANRALLYAGKASLELYRRSHSSEDLDRAIRHFTYLTRVRRADPERAEAAKELKAALALKTGGTSPGRAETQRPLLQDSLSPGPTDPSKVMDHGEQGASPLKRGPQSPQVAADDSSSGPSPSGVGGNPFCPGGKRISFSIPLPERRGQTSQAPVVRASLPPQIVTEAPPVAPAPVKPPRKLVVVIDPGHGGKDPGTVSPDGRLKEKDVTLSIAHLIKANLARSHPQIGVMLTRDEDRSLSIEERIALANALDADLFVSIHCNASTESSSHGIETYFASRASSRKALKVAARENGVPLARMSDLEATLYGESMTPKIAKSNQLADMIQKSVVQELGSRISQSEDRGVRRAPLSILLGAKMPAVVLECAFMSNRQDRRNLNNSGYLKRLSEGIALGISSCVQDMNRTDVRSLSARKGD